jgi:hypothetical protein
MERSLGWGARDDGRVFERTKGAYGMMGEK